MASGETVTATLDLDDLDLPGRPETGWDTHLDAGRAAIERAVRQIFSPLGTVVRIDIQPSRVIVALRVHRTPAVARQLLAKGIRLASAGKVGAAIETLTQALRADPANPQIHYNLGVASLERGTVERASASFVCAAAFSASVSGNLLLGLGNVAKQRGALERARHFYERALHTEPESPLIRRNLAVVLVQLGELGGAEQTFRDALAQDPESAETALGLGMVLAMTDRKNEAEGQLRAALALTDGTGSMATRVREELRKLGVSVEKPLVTRIPRGDTARTGRGSLTLLPATEAVLDATTEQTGFEFDFIAQPDLTVIAAIQVARAGVPRHRILYRPGAAAVDHLIAHECGHLVRLWTVPSGDRFLPISDPQLQVRAIEQLGQEFADLANSGVTPPTLSKLFEIIYPGTIRQVSNLPIDIRIERWIRREHPGLHAAQRTSLLAQLTHNEKVLSPEIEQHTPPTVYRASTAMNCAFAMAIAQLYGEPELEKAYRDTAIWEVGTELFEVIADVPDDARGDCALVDRWAEILGVRGWYRWAALDSLPPSQAVVRA